jgi:hypothetical protein
MSGLTFARKVGPFTPRTHIQMAGSQHVRSKPQKAHIL